MTEITFLRSVHHYDSYDDLFRLAELAGFPVMSVADLDVSAPGVYITAPMNGDWRAHVDSQAGRPRNAHLILWQLERPSGSGAVGKYAEENRELLYRRYVDEVWVGDARLADETELRFVPVGSHAGLGAVSREKVWDVAHMSYVIPRRGRVLSEFHGGSVTVAPNCWPPKRTEVLARTRIGLAVHQDDHPFIEPLRFAIFAAHGLPILSEVCADPRPYGNHAVFASLDNLAARMREMLSWGDERLAAVGHRTMEWMTVENEFGAVVRRAVEQRVRDWR